MVRCPASLPSLSLATTPSHRALQAMNKSSKLLNYISYRMRVTLADT